MFLWFCTFYLPGLCVSFDIIKSLRSTYSARQLFHIPRKERYNLTSDCFKERYNVTLIVLQNVFLISC